uniref:ATP-dependent DNA helicase CHL1 n=1 Tax=Coccidioides posadasii RMSCC 3488 TaxID=454284 RepID=A0A0J6HZH4_COCPO|nr:fanconi anemia group J protein [Coccidioides posadasii RMSCC 3488]
MNPSSKTFYHPYSPYDIQVQFMRSLYTCIEECKVGIFESPTGTVSILTPEGGVGKSLSLICGSLTWLRDHKRSVFLEDIENSDGDDEPEWILQYSRKEKRRTIRERRKRVEDRLSRIRKEELLREKAAIANIPFKKQRLEDGKRHLDKMADDGAFELDEYDSDNQETSAHDAKGNSDLSATTIALLEKLSGSAKIQDDFEEENPVKIFYCSRTHSQLAQFARELRRVAFPPSIPPETEDGEIDTQGEGRRHPDTELEEPTKHVSLGSRKTMCINPKVRRLGNATAINERCLDLQSSNVLPEHKCPFAPSKENELAISDFRDHVLAEVHDIEDIGKIGQRTGICPYYASRSVIGHSEIVTLPYQLLLQKSARDALDISLKDHVIIIDEAHNLMDVIANIHSVNVSLTQLRIGLEQLTIYARKYKARLKGKNRVYVAQVMRLLGAIAKYLESVLAARELREGAVDPSYLMSGKGVDQINLHKLSRYLQESKLARKVDGYIESSTSLEEKNSETSTTVPVLFQVQSFLLSLMNPSAEGRLFFEKNGNDVLLKYTLLDPTAHFREAVEEARAVILAGGTMSPMSDYRDHLFSYLAPGQLRTFSYGHVIPTSNLSARPVSRGILDTEFDFTFEKRNSRAMIIDLGKTISEICKATPDGVVAFFPSYDFLNQVVEIWKQPCSNSGNPSILDSLGLVKPLLYESKEKAMNTEALLQKYANFIDEGKGALLLSVMGGKLSEGINFSDRLGRGVIVIGLPFANIRSAEWQAKIQYVERKTYERSSGGEETRRSKAKLAGRDFYENACMRVVNQCIGRAIRHQHDYAAILMFDRRYGTARIQSKLPEWIRRSLVSAPIGATINNLYTFFEEKSSIEVTKEK